MLKQNRYQEQLIRVGRQATGKSPWQQSNIENMTPNMVTLMPTNTYSGPSSSKSCTIQQSPAAKCDERSKSNYDSYLQNMMKANLEKMSKMRQEHDKEKAYLEEQIRSLRRQNSLLMSQRVQSPGEKDAQINRLSAQLDQKKNYQRWTRKQQSVIKQLNPETEKIHSIQKIVSQLRLENSDLSQANRDLRSQISIVQHEVRRMRKNHQALQKQLNIYKAEKNQQNKNYQCMRLSPHKSSSNSKSKHGGRVGEAMSLSQSCHSSPNPSVQAEKPTDKKAMKYLQGQVQDRNCKLFHRDNLIQDLNKKVISDNLLALNIKYRKMLQGY